MTPDDLHATRRRLGMTQAALGALCGVTERQVHRWETGASPVPAYLPIVLDSIEHGPEWRQTEALRQALSDVQFDLVNCHQAAGRDACEHIQDAIKIVNRALQAQT